MTTELYYKSVVTLLHCGALKCYYFKDQMQLLKASIAYDLSLQNLCFYFYEHGVFVLNKDGLLTENAKKLFLFQNKHADKISLYLKMCGLPMNCIPQVESLTKQNYLRIVMGKKPFIARPIVLFKIRVNENVSPRYLIQLANWIAQLPEVFSFKKHMHLIRNNEEWESIKEMSQANHNFFQEHETNEMDGKLLRNIKFNAKNFYASSSSGPSSEENLLAKYLTSNWNCHLQFEENAGASSSSPAIPSPHESHVEENHVPPNEEKK